LDASYVIPSVIKACIQGGESFLAVRIRIRRPLAGVVDRVALSALLPGGVYDLRPSLARYLIATGAAEEVPVGERVSDQNEDEAIPPVFKGVTVERPPEIAPDVPRRKAARRRRR
jgi:hypothetical protein